jgi:hypothetical protein
MLAFQVFSTGFFVHLDFISWKKGWRRCDAPRRRLTLVLYFVVKGQLTFCGDKQAGSPTRSPAPQHVPHRPPPPARLGGGIAAVDPWISSALTRVAAAGDPDMQADDFIKAMRDDAGRVGTFLRETFLSISAPSTLCAPAVCFL